MNGQSAQDILMLDDDRVARKPHLAGRTTVPKRMETIDHQCPAVQDVNFGISHRNLSLLLRIHQRHC